MASQTLAEAKKLINNQIVVGVAEDIISLNPIFAMIPFDGYSGQAILANAQTTQGDSQVLAVDATITAKAQSASTTTTFTATKLIGDVEMDLLVQAQSESAGVDQIAIEVSSKAKSIARLFQAGMATGSGATPQMNSMHSMVDASQFTTASATQTLQFALLDELLDLVKSKDGQVDWIQMPARTMRSYKVLLRALGGVPADWVITLADGRTTIAYESVPVFKNEFLSIAETANGALLTTGALTSVWAGNFDDGSRKVGVAGIFPASTPMGIDVQAVGAQEAKDSQILRVKWYTNFANFNRRGLARLPSISN